MLNSEGVEEVDKDEFLRILQDEIEQSILDNLGVKTEIVSYDDLAARCPNIPSYLPKDKPLRIVTIDRFDPLPCGGTHVLSLSEIKGLTVTKVKSKKGRTKISYSLAG